MTAGNVIFSELVTVSWAGTAIAGLLDVTPGEEKRTLVDKTVLGDLVKSYRYSHLLDAGKLTVKVQYQPANHKSLHTALENKTLGAVVLVLNDEEIVSPATTYSTVMKETWTWSEALVESFKVSNFKEDANAEAEIVFQLNVVPVCSYPA